MSRHASVLRLLMSSALLSASTVSAWAAACDTPAHHAFDFWLGTWEVHTPAGKLAGINRIEREYGGCVVHERYTTEGGYSGESLNVFDVGRQVWHQTWVDNGGTLLVLEGVLRDGQMVLEGTTVGRDAKTRHQRITWTPRADGSVRQHWETAGDKAGPWTTAFDGLYTKR